MKQETGDRAYQRNARNQKQRAFSERLVKRVEKRREGCYLEMMKTPTGRYCLAELIVRSGARSDPFDTHGGVMSRKVGRMSIGLELDRYLQVIAPAWRQQMWEEWDGIERREGEEIDAAEAESQTERAQ